MTKPIRRGMTLLEVMIALAVLAFGLSGAFATVGYASRFQSTAAHVEEASALAQSLLSVLMAIPYAATSVNGDGGIPGGGAAGDPLLKNVSTTNDNDIADTAGNFTLATVPSGSFDHSDGELGTVAASVIPLPTSISSDGGDGGVRNGYQRYWNIAPTAVGPGVMIAVIVRWSEGGTWRRTVVVGTRYAP
jgi:prepilin-type N-terminal cleavage/methylation domain-containing protein